jgi:hypothetical protein
MLTASESDPSFSAPSTLHYAPAGEDLLEEVHGHDQCTSRFSDFARTCSARAAQHIAELKGAFGSLVRCL